MTGHYLRHPGNPGWVELLEASFCNLLFFLLRMLCDVLTYICLVFCSNQSLHIFSHDERGKSAHKKNLCIVFQKKNRHCILKLFISNDRFNNARSIVFFLPMTTTIS